MKLLRELFHRFGIVIRRISKNVILKRGVNILWNCFPKLLASYNLVTSEPSVEDFYHKNNWVLTEESAKYRRLVDGFYDRFDNVYERLGEIKEFQDKQASANQNDATYRRTLQNSAKRVLGELWRVKRTLDIYYHEACKCANRSRLMCMIIGFVKLGEGFWNDPDSFEDGYSEYWCREGYA